MDVISAGAKEPVWERLKEQRLPRWAELPDIELYMDQVLALADRYLGGLPGLDEKGLTASMVNNYVKQGIIPPPVRKKYSRSHLVHLIVICVLKPVLPIPMIRRLLTAQLAALPEDVFFDSFVELFAQTNQQTAEASVQRAEDEGAALFSVCAAALRARAEQALALALIPPEE